MKIKFKYKMWDILYTLIYNNIKKVKVKNMRCLINEPDGALIEYCYYEFDNNNNEFEEHNTFTHTDIYTGEQHLFRSKDELVNFL